MTKKPTNSAQFFKEDVKPASLQVTPVMAQLMQATAPGVQVPKHQPIITEAPKTTVKRNGAATVVEVDLPGEPPPIVDNALSHPGLIKVKEEKPPVEYPTTIKPEVVKQPKKTWPTPKIAELPKITLTDEIKEFLLWFKERANISKISDPSREHAAHGPSSGERDVNCNAANPLTYLIRRDRPKEDRSTFADEGHLAHEVAADFVKARFENLPYPYEKFAVKPYKPDMIKYAQEYAEYCYNACDEYINGPDGLPCSWMIEQRVCIDYVRDSWGTLDFGFIARDGDKLYGVSVDYKYGMGVDVNTENQKTGEKNWQLALYALGMVGMYLNVTDPDKPLAIHAITAHIFQPRIEEVAPPVVFTLPELLEHYLVKYLNAIDTGKKFLAEIREAEQAATTWDSSSIEGYQNVGKWCQFCKAKPICNAYQHSRGVPKAADMFKKALKADLITKTEKEPAKKLWDQGIISAEELAFIALNASKMKSLIDECVEVSVDLIQSGENLPDCAVEKTEGRRGWIDDQEQVIAGLINRGIDNPFEVIKKLVTITEAEKILGQGAVDELTEKSEGGLKLVHVSKVKNPAPIGSGAALMFKKHFENS